ncbi:ImmA/IrrE family metallo-endopeptidase [Streptomyces cucumeris]|uniref:ImmA/IrrE family metallo-endopeptidase n=1 Tax=Streptomyces cucumeris TaxID=2962890 RepID=UPI003D70EC41
MRWRQKRTNPTYPGLQERCEQRVDALQLNGTDWTVHALSQRLSELYDRPIHIISLPLPDGSPDGLLISAQDMDFIVYEQHLAPVHQRQVALHEIGHFICGHEATPVMSPETATLLLPSLDPDFVRRVLGRDHSQSESEAEAEYVGSLIGRQIGAWSTPRTLTVPPEAQELADRLSTLERPKLPRCHE